MAKTDDLLVFGELLRTNRAKQDKSKTEIAGELATTSSSIEKWETSNGLPKEEKLPQVAKVYRIDFEILLDAYRKSDSARKNLSKIRRANR